MCFVAKLFFFGTITTPNLLLLCFCPQLQVSIFIVWARFLPALVRVCFCFGCVGMVAGPALICYVFCCQIIFFGTFTTPNLLLLCFCPQLQVSIFIVLGAFFARVGSCLVLIVCKHHLCDT